MITQLEFLTARVANLPGKQLDAEVGGSQRDLISYKPKRKRKLCTFMKNSDFESLTFLFFFFFLLISKLFKTILICS